MLRRPKHRRAELIEPVLSWPRRPCRGRASKVTAKRLRKREHEVTRFGGDLFSVHNARTQEAPSLLTDDDGKGLACRRKRSRTSDDHNHTMLVWHQPLTAVQSAAEKSSHIDQAINFAFPVEPVVG